MLKTTWRRFLIKKLIISALALSVAFYLVLFKLPNLYISTQSNTGTPYFEDSRFQLVQNGEYWIYNNFIRAKSSYLRGNSTLTLTTHGTFKDLRYMQWLLHRWNAPINMAIYVQQNDLEELLKNIYYIKYCTVLSHSWYEWVSVQLVFPDKKLPVMLFRMSLHRPPGLRCRHFKKQVPQYKTDDVSKHQDPKYPLNLLRNVARVNAHTYFVLPLDPGIMPTRHFVRHFLQLAQVYKPKKPFQSIYCIPVFRQICDDSKLPKYKSELVAQLQPYLNGSQIVSPTVLEQLNSMRRWLYNSVQDGDVTIFEVSNLPDNCVAYVSVNALEPLYDQRYAESSYETNSTKLQVLVGLGFDFVLLDGTFLIRRNSSWQTKDSTDVTNNNASSLQKLDHIIELIKLNNLALGNPYLKQ